MRLAAQAAGPELIGYASLPVGVVTLSPSGSARPASPRTGSRRWWTTSPHRLLAFERVHCIAHEIRQGGVRLLGTSGTVTTLAGVALGLARYRRPLVDGTVLTRRGGRRRRSACCAGSGRDGLAQHPCVGPERADFVLPGCAVFEAIRRTWPAPEVMVADRGLREGMLLRMMRERNAHRPAARHDRTRQGVSIQA